MDFESWFFSGARAALALGKIMLPTVNDRLSSLHLVRLLPED